MFFFKHRLKMTSLRIGKHRIVKNIASLRKVNIAHPYLAKTQLGEQEISQLVAKAKGGWPAVLG